MLSRRAFLQRSSLVAFAPLVPAFLPRLAWSAPVDKDGRILVVIQMDGGNDGLNTVVPYKSDTYRKLRPTLQLGRSNVIKVDGFTGLNPAMRPAADLINDGRMAIVQGVGYPNPNRSHFDSMAIWHTARLEAEQHKGNGWIGNALDEVGRARSGAPDSVYVGGREVPQALLGRRSVAMSLEREDELVLQLPLRADRAAASPSADDVASFVQRRVLDAVGTAGDLAEAARGNGGGAAYPQTGLGKQLSLVSRLIKAGGGTRVYYVAQTGYDTHGGQLQQHEALLAELAGGMKAFLDDLKSAKLDDRVLLLAFSEFGRRVEENNSQGTDHGTSGPVFLAGSGVQPGLHGVAPDLEHLEDGDLKTSIDFRRIYSTLLGDWLNVPTKQALAGAFEPMPLLRQA